MKTVKRMDLIDSDMFNFKRVKDDIADKMIKNEGWEYCPKSEWKINVRDYSKEKNKE
jgi:hypothetical protein